LRYEKPFKTFDQQAEIIIGRGMSADRDVLILHLADVGYYRLSGYWYIFRKPNEERFQEGTTFERVWGLYVFDRQFRLVVLDAVERVEIFVRTQLAYLLAEETGPFGFEKSSNLPRMNGLKYGPFIDRCHTAYQRSREPFALHFKETYGDVHDLPPYWMLVNLMDFGMVVTLYKGASVAVRQTIADELDVSTRVLDSWLVAINTVRNICAHHGRLWNRVTGTPPAIPKDTTWHEPYEVSGKHVFGTLTILSYLLQKVAPDTLWRGRLFDLLGNLSDRDMKRMGFAEGWQTCPMWAPWIPGQADGEERGV